MNSEFSPAVPAVPAVPAIPAVETEATSAAEPTPELEPASGAAVIQVRFKAEGDRLRLIFPSETETQLDWLDLWQQFQIRLDAGKRFWTAKTPVELVVGDRLLDQRQLQLLADALTEADLQLQRVQTSRRQTAVTAATAGYSVDQESSILPLQPIGHPAKPTPPPTTPSPLADPLYLQTTLRSGTEIRHPGTVVVLGDLNPGSAVVADGDILVWGRLRGIAHAGASGNAQCRIMALQMEPTQLRIADQVARPPANPPEEFYPEVAYVVAGSIHIARAADFAKTLVPPLPNLPGSS